MSKNTETVHIVPVKYGHVDFCILGITPIILARMTEKAKFELLMPKGGKSRAEKNSTLKHDPMREFRDSPYTAKNAEDETLLQGLSIWFKKCVGAAALDMPGATKSQIGRLVWAEGERVPIYGVPRLFMAVTRSAGMNAAPDIRTRCIVPQWATRVRLSFMCPVLSEEPLISLMAAAGIISGVGDWRPGKGSGNFGQFEIVSPDDPRYLRVVENGGRAVQQSAMDNPVAYDDETESLLELFYPEARRRGFEVVEAA